MNTDKTNAVKTNAKTGTDKTEEIYKMSSLTEKVIGAAYEVANTLGVGFLEKVYERALVKELTLRGVKAVAQVPLKVA